MFEGGYNQPFTPPPPLWDDHGSIPPEKKDCFLQKASIKLSCLVEI